MRLFWEVTRRAFRRHLTYRAAALAGLVTNIFFGLVRASILVALYGEREQVAGLSVQDAITYTGLTQAVIVYLSIFGWYDLMNAVHQGEIAADLLKPMRLFTFWLAQDLGRALVGLLLRGLSIMLVYALIFDLTYPVGALQWGALLLTLALSWLLSFAYLTPFPHLLNTVVEVYLGVVTGPALVRALLMQALWAAGLIALCQLVLARATRRLVILGG